MKSICFACGGEFHLLVSFILATTTYRNDRRILLLFKNPRLLEYLDRIEGLDIWDEVIIIRPEEPLEAIQKQIEMLQERIKVLHFFSWGFPPFNMLFNLCKQKNAKIIFTDEGIGTYMPYKRFDAWINTMPEHKKLTNGFDIKAIDEIWLLEPKLYLDEQIVPVNRIAIEEFYNICLENKKITEDFNKLFPLSSTLQLACDVIYFRQYFYVYGFFSEDTDAFIDRFVLALLQNYKFSVKNHPAYTSNLYDHSYDVEVNLPWEAILISKKINSDSGAILPKIFISPTSSGMFKSCALGIPGAYIFIHKLIEKYTDYHDSSVDEFIKHNLSIFPEAKLYTPESWADFQEILEKVAEELQISSSASLLDVVKYENDGLIQDQIHSWSLIKKYQDQISFFENKFKEVTASKQSLEKELSENSARKASLENDLREVTASKQNIEKELHLITSSKAWRFALIIRSIRIKLFPENSILFRMLRFLWRLIR